MSQNDYIGKTLKPWPILVDHYSEQRNTEAAAYHPKHINQRIVKMPRVANPS
ncbi:hypothetical protein THZG08_730015 [Vibrio owensii]|nr:hypothetical protein THZG08_730015 [Vibrio owensii]CAH1591415.1 hypothetical protein THOA03_720015 [Vibrio owensii]